MQKELDKIEKNAGRVAEQQNMAKSAADVLMKDVKVYQPTAVAAVEMFTSYWYRLHRPWCVTAVPPACTYKLPVARKSTNKCLMPFFTCHR